MVAKRRSRWGESNPQAKLNDQAVREIRLLYETGSFSQQELGGKFGVDQKVISAIVRRKSWTHVR